MKKVYQMKKLLLLLFFSLPLVSCGTINTTCPPGEAAAGMESRVSQLQDENRRLESELSNVKSSLAQSEEYLERQKEINQALESEIESAEERVSRLQAQEQDGFAQAEEQQQLTAQGLFPPENAEIGECFTRVLLPAQYRTVEEQILLQEASRRVQVIPAEYETVTEKVMVQEASERVEVVPAQYEWQEEEVMVEPARTVMREIPAVYETVTEQVLVSPARSAWKPGTEANVSGLNEAGDVICLTEEPAEYETVTKKILKEPARTVSEEIPPVYETVRKKVMVSPPSTRTVEIPAEYKEVQVQKLKSPAREEFVDVPAQYRTITKKELVSEAHMEWMQILCKADTTREKVSEVQQALKDAGFSPGPIDGIIGPKTTRALNDFQQSKGLMLSQCLTRESMEALGVSIQ